MTWSDDALHEIRQGMSASRTAARDEVERLRAHAIVAWDDDAAEGALERSPSRQSTDLLLKLLAERSTVLHDHLGNVAELAEALGRECGLPERDVHWVRLAAELHDVGKIAIPDAILDKPGPLTQVEWVVMQAHTLIGERIVRSAAALAPAAQLVRSSHERYDGEGYPDGLRAGRIELGARIIAICDAYDAMASDRVYRASRSHEEALAELRRCAGTQFDPELVGLFCSIVEDRRDRDAPASPGRFKRCR